MNNYPNDRTNSIVRTAITRFYCVSLAHLSSKGAVCEREKANRISV